MNDSKVYPCGCVNTYDPRTGAARSARKCDRHRARQRAPRSLAEAYYAELGLHVGPDAVPTRHVAEMADALGPFASPTTCQTRALEIGCGVSPYVHALRGAGWAYEAVEPSEWAARHAARAWGADVHACDFESFVPSYSYGLILAAHSLEHMEDAPGAVRKMRECLAPGGLLYLLVPDDTDPVNPDHLWFFNTETLVRTLMLEGFRVGRLETRRVVAHENFLYCLAHKD